MPPPGSVHTAVLEPRTNPLTPQIRRHANLSKTGALPADPVRESVSLILDIINLFTSIVRVLLLQQGGGRRR